jgi:hypothetical protein
MPSLEHVTWSDPTVTPSRLAISSRLIPCVTNSLIFSIACGVNLTARLPLAGWLAVVIVMVVPLEVAQATSAACTCSASLFITLFALLSRSAQPPTKHRSSKSHNFHFLFARAALFNVIGII